MHLVGLEMVWVSSTSLRPKSGPKTEFRKTNLRDHTTRGANSRNEGLNPRDKGRNACMKAATPHHTKHKIPNFSSGLSL